MSRHRWVVRQDHRVVGADDGSLFASVNETPRRWLVVPLVCSTHVAPPLVVRRMVPASPTAVPVFASVDETSKRLTVTPLVCATTSHLVGRPQDGPDAAYDRSEEEAPIGERHAPTKAPWWYAGLDLQVTHRSGRTMIPPLPRPRSGVRIGVLHAEEIGCGAAGLCRQPDGSDHRCQPFPEPRCRQCWPFAVPARPPEPPLPTREHHHHHAPSQRSHGGCAQAHRVPSE